MKLMVQGKATELMLELPAYGDAIEVYEQAAETYRRGGGRCIVSLDGAAQPSAAHRQQPQRR
jgi:hypothetical protein